MSNLRKPKKDPTDWIFAIIPFFIGLVFLIIILSWAVMGYLAFHPELLGQYINIFIREAVNGIAN